MLCLLMSEQEIQLFPIEPKQLCEHRVKEVSEIHIREEDKGQAQPHSACRAKFGSVQPGV